VEEAVQETWLAVIKGISGFEGRAPLKSWIFSILANQARRMAVREAKRAQIEDGIAQQLGPDPNAPEGDDDEPGMGANGKWEIPPVPWGFENPEAIMLREETLGVIEGALETMPSAQRQVVLLRDVEGLGAEEVCNVLGVSETNVRVLLHRGRARVRRALDAYAKQGVKPEPSAKRRSPTT
jgi:RNA polymerase sigma-70 factor (ECF subfamily)